MYELVVGRQRKKEGVSSSAKQDGLTACHRIELRKEALSQMETNELVQKERYQEVERALARLVEEREDLEDGNLKGLEQKVFKGVIELGRKILQCRINQSEKKAAAKQVGDCGHKQYLVDYREKHILTIMGKVAFKRAGLPM